MRSLKELMWAGMHAVPQPGGAALTPDAQLRFQDVLSTVPERNPAGRVEDLSGAWGWQGGQGGCRAPALRACAPAIPLAHQRSSASPRPPCSAPLLHLRAAPGQRARPGDPGQPAAGPAAHLKRARHACTALSSGPRPQRRALSLPTRPTDRPSLMAAPPPPPIFSDDTHGGRARASSGLPDPLLLAPSLYQYPGSTGVIALAFLFARGGGHECASDVVGGGGWPGPGQEGAPNGPPASCTACKPAAAVAPASLRPCSAATDMQAVSVSLAGQTTRLRGTAVGHSSSAPRAAARPRVSRRNNPRLGQLVGGARRSPASPASCHTRISSRSRLGGLCLAGRGVDLPPPPVAAAAACAGCPPGAGHGSGGEGG